MAGKRRTKGDGGLSQRHDHATCPPAGDDGERPKHACKGRWVGTFSVMTPTGRKVRKTVYGKTQAEAKSKLNKAQRDAESGVLSLDTSRFDAWANYWLEEIAGPELKPQSYYVYETRLRLYILPTFGNRKMADIRPEHIRAWIKEQQASGLAKSTIAITFAVLKSCLRDAAYNDKIAANPCLKVRAPKKGPKKAKAALTVEQAYRVLDEAGDDPRWWLAVFYGMRQGEVLGLRWGDIDWNKKTLTIAQTQQYDRRKQAVVFGTPKTESSARTIPLLPMIEARLKVKYLSDETPPDDVLVFRSKNGDPTPAVTDYQRWKRLLVRATKPPFAPIPHISLHSARNTAASVMDEAGLSPLLVAAILGHTNIEMTGKYQLAEVERIRRELGPVADLLALPYSHPDDADDDTEDDADVA